MAKLNQLTMKLTGQMPDWLMADLRSDHAGETGAVYIYRGILAVSADRTVCEFASGHLETEARHLQVIEEFLPAREQSVFLPLWRVMGFLTGAIPALFGANAVYATIAAVEEFVDQHYRQQIERLQDATVFNELATVLEACRKDEVSHRDEAAAAQTRQAGPILSLWCRLVGRGSSAAVAVARWR